VPDPKSENKWVVSAPRIVSFIAARAAAQNGMIDLSEHTLADLISETADVLTATIDRRASTGDALAAFFPSGVPQNKRPQVLLVISENHVEGIILHPTVRYR
jgi:hypothetical protein